MEKQADLGKSLYELINILIEIEIEHHEKTGEYINEEVGKYIESFDKNELEKLLNTN